MSKKKKSKQKEQLSPEVENNMLMKTLSLILQHHILFWLMVFPPVAIYRIVKYKILHKWVLITLLLVFVLLIVCITDSYLNPTATIDSDISRYLDENNFGEVREIEYVGAYNGYHMSEAITKNGFFVVYFYYTEDRMLHVDTIVSMYTDIKDGLSYNQFRAVYRDENAYELFSQINPAVIKFLTQTDKYGTVEKLVEQYPNSQVIMTTKGKYQFKYQYYNTVAIRQYNPEDDSWNDVMNRDNIIEMKQDFVKALKKEEMLINYYEIKEVTEYGINESEIYYRFINFCDNVYRIVKDENGRFILQGYDTNPVPQDKLAEAWAEYQNSPKEKNTNE